MRRKWEALFVSLFLIGIIGTTAYGITFGYFTEQELTVFNERVTFLAGGDLVTGPVRTNDTLKIRTYGFSDYEFFITSQVFNGPEYWPDYPGIMIEHAPMIFLPERADTLRRWAEEQGWYMSGGDSVKMRVVLGDHTFRLWQAPAGMPFDTTVFTDYELPDSAAVFFDCRDLILSGTVATTLILGSSGRIGLEDNVAYLHSDAQGRRTDNFPIEKLAVIAEGEIKILNTWPNGRENQLHGSDIILDGVYVALNESFTFENQNDPDSGYVCACIPDDRGQIFLNGGIYQKRRSYVHRSTNGSTGYLKVYRYDQVIRMWDFGLFDLRENIAEPSVLDFGECYPGDTLRDTVRLINDYVPIPYDLNTDTLSISSPFHHSATVDSQRFVQTIPLAFAPTVEGEWSDTLRYRYHYVRDWEIAVPVHGVCRSLGADDPLSLQPSSFNLSAYPNPFNATATLRFTLPTSAEVNMKVFDVLGRNVAQPASGRYEAGEHVVPFDASALPSGIYLARLTANQNLRTHKLLLIR